MKPFYLLCAFCVLFSTLVSAQIPPSLPPTVPPTNPPTVPPGNQVTFRTVSYVYDAFGNRTGRFSNPADADPGTGAKFASPDSGTEDASSTNATILSARLLPNPTAGPFSIELSLPASTLLIRIFDLNGRLIGERTQPNTARADFDISHLPSAAYLILVHTESLHQFYKLIKQ